jgi:hypothetical protein
MERKIGETFEYQGKIYKVAEFDDCRNCAFRYINCSSLKSIIGNCMDFLRNDGINVKFEEIKKDMEIKDNKLTINIPDGMEIDVESSDFKSGVIKFKKKELTYEDIKASLKLNENMTGIDVADENVNRLYAINRLMCIAKFYNGDWKPNWSSVENKYHILYCNRSQCYTTDYKTFFDINTVYFKCEKDAQAVIDNPNFREILDAIYDN